MEFRDVLRMIRNELGINQAELANALHVSFSSISRWENGKTLPNRSVLASLSEFVYTNELSAGCRKALAECAAEVKKAKIVPANETLYSVEHSSLRQLIDDAAFPIYVCDMETDTLLYMNQKACAMIGEDASATRKKCYECLMHRDTPCTFCHKDELCEDEFKSYNAYSPADKVTYRVQGKLIQWNGQSAQVRYVFDAEPEEREQPHDGADDAVTCNEQSDHRCSNEEILRIAAETDKRVMIVYDVKNKSCRVESHNLFSAEYGETFADVPQSLIDLGITAAGSENELRSLFERISGGEQKVKVSLQLHSGTDRYEWFECNATTVTDANGAPDYAVLVFHNITEQRVKEAVFKKWQQSIDSRPPESFTLFRCNLSRDSSLDEHYGKLLRVELPPEVLSFNARTKLYADEYVCPADRRIYTAFLDSDSLLSMFYRGERTNSMEYREISVNGEEKWRRLTVEMVEYLDSTDVQAFLMYEDIDEAKKAELEAKELAETDPMTGALNRGAFGDKVDEIIRNGESANNAVLMLDMDGFKQLNDMFGHSAGDQALQDVVAVLRSFSQNGDLVCRLGGDEFLLFLQNTPYDAVVSKTAQQICDHIRKSYSKEVMLSASIGIAVYPRDGECFDELYASADKALYRAKQIRKGTYAFFSVTGEEQAAVAEEAAPAVRQKPLANNGAKRRILVVDDDEIGLEIIKSIFCGEYIIETARNGAEAMIRLHHFGVSISAVLLDLMMPGIDGFSVLRKMQNNLELRTVPVVVVTGDDERSTLLKAIELGAAEYVTKPVDAEVLRVRVHSVISKAENERLRAQNSYLMLQRDEEAKYRTVLESTGTVVVEFNWRTRVFIYDSGISKYIAGNYDHRGIWQVFLSDMVAESNDVKAMQDMMIALSNRGPKQNSMLVKLKTPSGDRHWFRMNNYKIENEYGLADKIILTFNDVHEEVLANDKLLFQATRDEMTGLYNHAGFIEKATEMVTSSQPGYYTLSCLDIGNFKVINDQYGEQTGDGVLRHISDTMQEFTTRIGGLVGRHMADTFMVLIPTSMCDSPETSALHMQLMSPSCLNNPIKIRIGRYLINDTGIPINTMFDRATMAEESIRGKFDRYIADYTDIMRAKLLKEQDIVNNMEKALKNGEFETWLQPQYNHTTGAVIGAEALVRWKKGGEYIPPSEFVPIFERNGFIYNMDQYVWEQVCIILRRMLDEGKKPLPISVNISRLDIFHNHFVSVISGIVNKYGIPYDLVRLEVTESAFSEATDVIVDKVKQLIKLGFTVEIDDFGSGYSSLNTLKDVPADILKLDMRFFEKTDNEQRGGNIIESVIRMAKWLGMSVIAEGVEKREQADFLKSVGCIYIQGYLYAKPMPVGDYEKLLSDSSKEENLSRMITLKSLDNNAFWDPDSMDTLVFNSYVGAACIFECTGEKIEMVRVSDDFMKMLGSSITPSDALLFEWSSYLDDADQYAFGNAVMESLETHEIVNLDVVLRGLPGYAEKIYLRLGLRVIASTGDRILVYCLNENTTAQRNAEQKQLEAEKKQKESARQLKVVMDNVNGGVSAIIINDDGTSRFIMSNEKYFDLYGYSRQEAEKMNLDIMTLIEEEDFQEVMEKIRKLKADRIPAVIDYRIRRKDGKRALLRANCSLMNMEGYGEVITSVITDVTKQRSLEDQLRSIVDNIYGGVSALYEEDGHTVFAVVNDQFFKILGFENRAEYEKKCENDKYAYIYPADRERVKKQYTEDDNILQFTMDYRIIRNNDGEIRYIRNNIKVIDLFGIDQPVHLSVINDVTDEHEGNEQLRFLNESAHDILAQSDSEVAINELLSEMVDYFACERAYIFEISPDKKTASNTYERCRPGAESRIEYFQNTPISVSEKWIKELQSKDYYVVKNAQNLGNNNAMLREHLKVWNTRSLIIASLKVDGNLIGYIGIDNPGRLSGHTGRLVAIADYFAVLINRRDLNAKIDNDSKMLISLMNDTPGGFVRMKLNENGAFVPLFSNEGFVRMVGISHEKLHEIFGNDVLAGVYPDDRDIISAAGAKMLAEGKAQSARFRIINGKGDYIWLSMYGKITKESSGEVYLNVYYSDASAQVSEEQKQKDLLDNLPCGAALYEYDGKDLSVIHINKSYWQLVGRDPARYDHTSVLNVVHPDDVESIKREIKEAIEQERNIKISTRILCGNSEYKPFDIEAKIKSEDNGKYLMFASYSAISEQTMSMHEILPIALSTMMSYSDDFSFIKDKASRYISCSRSVAKAMGLSDEKDVIGKTDFDVFDRESAEKFIKQDEEIIGTGSPLISYIEKVKLTDGSVIMVSSSKYPITDAFGNSVGIYGVSRDVTAQREKETRLELLTDSIPGGLVTYKYKGKKPSVIYCNSGFCELFGLEYDEEKKRTDTDPVMPLFDEDRHILREQFDELMSNGTPIDCIYRIHSRSGRCKWIHHRAVLSEQYDDTVIVNAALFDITEQQEEKERLRQQNEEFRIATEHSMRTICRYSVANKTLRVSKNAADMFGVSTEMRNVPTSSISQGLISHDTESAYTDFYNRINNGEKECTRTFCRKSKDGWRWLEARATTTFDSDGNPASAIISYADVTEQQEKEAAYRKWVQALAERDDNSYTLYRVNMNKNDSYDSKEGSLLKDVAEIGEARSFSERVINFCDRYVYVEDKDKYRQFLDPDAMLAGYYRGKRSDEITYRQIEEDGSYRWIRLSVELIEYPNSKDIEAYLMYEDIDDRMTTELKTKQMAETDPLTGVLNRTAFAARMKDIIESSPDGCVHSLLMVDIDNFKQVNDKHGHTCGDHVLRSLTKRIGDMLDPGDLIGRLGGDEFFVFLKNIMTSENAAKKAGRICKIALPVAGSTDTVTLSVGIVMVPDDGNDFDVLYGKVDRAMYKQKKSGKNGYRLYKD